MERDTRLGCGPAMVATLLFFGLVGLPIVVSVVSQHAVSPLLIPSATALGLAVVFFLVAWLTRCRPGWRTVNALGAALLALTGFLLLDAGLRDLPILTATGAAALRLGVLVLYALAAAWWAPHLAGLGRPRLAAVLGLGRVRLAPLALGVATAALVTLPWSLTGALGDRLTSLELLFQALARVLPDILLAWGVVFFLLNAVQSHGWLAGLLTMLAYWGAFAAGQILFPGSAAAAASDIVILVSLPLLLTELRARESGICPLVPPAWAAYAAPILLTDPRDVVVQQVPATPHIVSYGISLGLIVVLGLALWGFRQVALRTERQSGLPFLSPRVGQVLAVGLALASLVAWGGLLFAYGEPRFYDDGFLIIMSEQADLGPAAAIPDRNVRLEYVYRALVETAERSQVSLRAELDALGVPYRPYYIINMIRVDGHRWLMGRFAGRPGVAQVILNPNVRVYPMRQPLTELLLPEDNTPPAGVQDNLQAIGVPAVWAQGVTGEGIVVAGQDTGFDWTHPALQSHYRGWDGTTAHHDYNWHDSWDDTAVPWDDDIHGTHTMGTIVGDDGGKNRPGVAPGARWIGCRNMRRGFGNPGAYAECIEFFLAPYPHGGDPFRDGDVTMAPNVVNNSWGCPTWEGCSPDTLRPAAEALHAAGIMMVVSAGNEGPACATVADPPANYDAVFSVGATDVQGDGIAFFSSRGPVGDSVKPDISAPGQEVRSCVPGGGYALLEGTSMAGPHVAGVVALVWSASPALAGQIDATEALLCRTAQPRPVERVCTPADKVPENLLGGLFSNPICACGDVTGVPNNVYGCGVVDAAAAVHAALGGSPR